MRTLAIIAVLACAAPAHADSKDDAEALFKKGKKLAGDKRYADACAAFEKSDALDPGIGIKLNVAKCYQDWGKLARAHRWYGEAEKLAAATKDERLDKIRELVTEVDADVPRLTVRVPSGADARAATIKLDGKPLPPGRIGKQMRVDPGPHEIVYTTNGATKTKLVPLERGGEREITLELPDTGTPDPSDDDGADASDDDGTDGADAAGPGTATPERPGRGRRIIGLTMIAAGSVGLGVAGYLTLDARGTYNDALDTHCSGLPTACTDEGLTLTRDARSQANTATIIAIAGGAVAVGGLVLYLTARQGEREPAEKSALYLAPVLGSGGGGFVVGGGF